MSSTVRVPELNGLQASWDMLTRGLHVDNPMIQGADSADLATVRLGRRRLFVLGHPDHVDHVLHEGADTYLKSIEYELLRAVLGLNLFTDEDESWRRHRMLLNPMMAKRHVRGMVDLMIDPIEQFVDRIDTGDPRIELEMAGNMVELTMDVVGTALFGHQFGDVARKMQGVVTTGLRGAEVATRLLMVAAPPVFGIRLAAGTLHHLPLRLPGPVGGLQWVMHTVDDAVWSLINDRRAHPNDNDDLLNLLLSVEDDSDPLPLKRVRDEVTTFMLAGHETTANALAWMWYLLALNPDARARMLEEVDTLEGQRPTVDDLASLPWTTACFQEAMRFYPPAWVIPRVARRDDVIDGVRIPKGSTVIVPIHRIHHDERWWPDPEVFDPSRFMPGAGKDRHRSAYLPFGGGRRICIGTSFALMETTLITAMMSQRFVFDLKPGHPVEPEATLTLRPRNGVRMIGRRRGYAVSTEVAA